MIDLRLGDCLEVLKTIPDNSVDSVVCDPPYHLTSTKGGDKGFMGKEWDGGDIAFRTDVWKECLRVLKPGGHLLAFGGSRTYHRLAVAVEDAGFEIRDQIMWVFGSGFPKSHNIGKAIDKIQGNEREVVGEDSRSSKNACWGKADPESPNYDGSTYGVGQWNITKGNSDWEGWGSALKPAHEPIVMARKPLSEKSIAENVLKWGTGGINIDGCRISIGDEKIPRLNVPYEHKANNNFGGGNDGRFGTTTMSQENVEGRFPANIMFDEEAGKLLDEQSGKSKTKPNKNYKHSNTNTDSNTFTNRGTYTPRKDEGGASRYFYCPKVSKKERGQGNNHPTLKPIKLMEYLITLITPQNGVVLDCFMGSGSTGIAAKNLGFNFIGIEKEPEYMEIAKQRIGE